MNESILDIEKIINKTIGRYSGKYVSAKDHPPKIHSKLENSTVEEQLEAGKKEDLRTIGEILKSGRETLNMSINDVCAILKVKSKDIISLEQDSLSELTSHLYIVGFIKSYARLLKVDIRLIEEKIKDLKIESNTTSKKHKLLNLDHNEICTPNRETFFNAILILIVLQLLIISFNKLRSRDMLTTQSIISELEKQGQR